MNGSHWSDDELIEHFYEIGSVDPAHLESCGECRDRWQRLLAKRRAISEGEEVSSSFLAAQRQSIYRRLDGKPSAVFRWAPALALALTLIVGAFFFHPAAPRPVPLADASDAQLLSDVYNLEQASEPKAAAPIRGLFERE